MLRLLMLCLGWLLIAGGDVWATEGHPKVPEDRYANTVRLRHAIESTGVRPGPDVDRKLAAMSDREIERLVEEHQSMGYTGNPLMVIAGAITLLVLIVLLLVAIVE